MARFTDILVRTQGNCSLETLTTLWCKETAPSKLNYPLAFFTNRPANVLVQVACFVQFLNTSFFSEVKATLLLTSTALSILQA